VITPRRTRLVRVPDLHDFRRVTTALCALPGEPGHRLVIVPTRGAALTLDKTLSDRGVDPEARPPLLTRDEVYDALHARLASPPRRLGTFERDAIAQAAAFDAARAVGDLPFQVRPGLVAELLRFYDHLRRQSQLVRRFEELITDALGGGDLDDRGAERLLRQTRFLARTFRTYEAHVAGSGAVDEHLLRERLTADADAVPLSHVVVTVPDWIADPAGLYVADFDLLNRLPNLAATDIVCTEAVLGSGFHERLHTWWPGIEEVGAADIAGPTSVVRPQLVCPVPQQDVAPLWFTHRDREEELLAVARRLAGTPGIVLDRVAVVFKRPLPYLYLAEDTLGAAGLAHVASDALPLATEPVIATIDLVLDAVETDFARDATIALLRSPHLARPASVTPDAISALDRAPSVARRSARHGLTPTTPRSAVANDRSGPLRVRRSTRRPRSRTSSACCGRHARPRRSCARSPGSCERTSCRSTLRILFTTGSSVLARPSCRSSRTRRTRTRPITIPSGALPMSYPPFAAGWATRPSSSTEPGPACACWMTRPPVTASSTMSPSLVWSRASGPIGLGGTSSTHRPC
jgi:hypothetical protein